MTVYNRFNRWSKCGLWQELIAELAAAGPPVIAMIDSAAVRAHRSASSAKGREQGEAIGRSRGGRTTKIHTLCDTEGRLYAPMHLGATSG